VVRKVDREDELLVGDLECPARRANSQVKRLAVKGDHYKVALKGDRKKG
jgi:hypothetical protein